MSKDKAIDIGSPQQQDDSHAGILKQRRRVLSPKKKKKIPTDRNGTRRQRKSASAEHHFIFSIQDALKFAFIYTLLLTAAFKLYFFASSLGENSAETDQGSKVLLRSKPDISVKEQMKKKEETMAIAKKPALIETDKDKGKKEPRSVSTWWWLDDEEDDWFEHLYISPEDQEANYHALRDLGVKHHFNGACGHYRFDRSDMPDATVIITVQNEETGMLSMTVQSILARTPPDLLREIIIVDDSGADHALDNANEEEIAELLQLSPKVKVIHNEERIGCGKSRMVGANMAEGEVVVFVDSHIEMESATWLEHLLLPILENPRTVATQTIDVIDDLGEHKYGGLGHTQWGIVKDDFIFGYQAERFEESVRSKEVPSMREPYETPFAPGSLFAIRREEFFRLGGYDRGLYVWGGENTELALKAWMCGGRMVMVPCSRVGHMYRIHMKKTGRWPPLITAETMERAGFDADYKKKYKIKSRDSGDFEKIVKLNNLRVLSLWANDKARMNYQKAMFHSENLPSDWQELMSKIMQEPAALEQKQKKKENQCQDFDWFDKHVYMRLTGHHNPLYS